MSEYSNTGEVHSPSHIAMTGHDFSPEDIQALLGGVLPEHVSTTTTTVATTAAAAAAAAETSTATTAQATLPLQQTLATTSTATTTPQAPSPLSEHTMTTTTANDSISAARVAAARTERKRKLEKQRRSDVNRQFAELQAALRRIEVESPEEARGLPAYTPNNRVDLMARTVALLENLHQANKKQKSELADVREQLEGAKKAGEETAAKLKDAMMAPQAMGNNKVMMMVPMLIGGGENGAAVPMATPYGMPGAFTMSSSGTTTTAMPSDDTNSRSQQQQQQPQMMPWMIQPSPQQGMMPWMMQPQLPNNNSTDGQKQAADSNSKSNSNKVGGNLAHCA